MEQKVRFSRLEWLLLFAPIGAVFLLAFPIVLMNLQGVRAAAALLVYVAVFLLFVFGWFALPKCYYLHLTHHGLSQRYITGFRSWRWDEVSNFRVVTNSNSVFAVRRYIVFDFQEASSRRSEFSRISRLFAGHDVQIQALFDIDSDDLARLLNRWQRRCSQGPVDDDVDPGKFQEHVILLQDGTIQKYEPPVRT